MGFCPCVHLGNSWPLPAASVTWGGHLNQIKKTFQILSFALHVINKIIAMVSAQKYTEDSKSR